MNWRGGSNLVGGRLAESQWYSRANPASCCSASERAQFATTTSLLHLLFPTPVIPVSWHTEPARLRILRAPCVHTTAALDMCAQPSHLLLGGQRMIGIQAGVEAPTVNAR